MRCDRQIETSNGIVSVSVDEASETVDLVVSVPGRNNVMVSLTRDQLLAVDEAVEAAWEAISSNDLNNRLRTAR